MVGLVQGLWFLMHHKYMTIARTWFGYPADAQSQGDAARPGMGQVPRELQAAAHLSTLSVDLHAEACDFSLQSAPLPTLTSISQRGQQLL